MLRNVYGVAKAAKHVNQNFRMPNKWMFPSGVNYFAIADRSHHDDTPRDQLKWMVPSGVNYKPRSAPFGGMSSSNLRSFSSKNRLTEDLASIDSEFESDTIVLEDNHDNN